MAQGAGDPISLPRGVLGGISWKGGQEGHVHGDTALRQAGRKGWAGPLGEAAPPAALLGFLESDSLVILIFSPSQICFPLKRNAFFSLPFSLS